MPDLLGGLPVEHDWTPPALPDLADIHELAFDTETNGLQWWEKHRPIGCSITRPDGSTLYLPWGHQGGGNLDENQCRAWAHRELRNKHLVGLNIKFDIHMMRAWGVDLEAQGCTFSDVGHYAALLDDHRHRFSLDSLVRDYLGIEKVGKELDATRMATYHAGEVAPRAEADAWQVHTLKAKLWPLLDAQELQTVRQLEDDIIPVVCEMERQGTLIDHALLERWLYSSQQDFERCLWKMYRETDLNIDPGKQTDKVRLFHKLQLPLTKTTSGQPSFTDAVLKATHHPVIELLRRALKLKSLRSKYLLKYQKAVDSQGVLRYALHQLRAESVGTISGRFSSSAITRGVGVNIQQVMKADPEEQYVIRQLHVPAQDTLFLSADAMQMEYRLFASYASNPAVLQAYQKNPLLSFHDLIWKMLQPFKSDITYRETKNLNFAKIYAAGPVRLAQMLGFITEDEATRLRKEKASRGHPKLRQAVAVEQIYAKELPEVSALLKKASALASTRGYIKTVLGRRMRFPNQQHLHKALNGIIQGSAADICKQKLVALHRARAHTGFAMRFTVHDEVDGDIPNLESATRVQEILNQQTVSSLQVPILWDVATGATWKDAS